MNKNAPRKGSQDVPSGRAISIQQPYVEEILRGIKKYEYRSRQTHIRGRVYLYASKQHGEESRWDKLGLEPGDLPAGVIVGSVEIIGCKYFENEDRFGYKLKNPRRYKKHLVPKNQPQPCFFFPFGKVVGRKKSASKSVRAPRKQRSAKKNKTPKIVLDTIARLEQWYKENK